MKQKLPEANFIAISVGGLWVVDYRIFFKNLNPDYDALRSYVHHEVLLLGIL